MKVFSLYFLFTCDLDTIKHSQIGHMEKALNPIELAALHWVNAAINLCKKRQILNILQLNNFLDVVKANIQELETLDHLEAFKLCNSILGNVKSPKNWKCIQALDRSELIRTNEELLDPEVWKILNLLNLISCKR